MKQSICLFALVIIASGCGEKFVPRSSDKHLITLVVFNNDTTTVNKGTVTLDGHSYHLSEPLEPHYGAVLDRHIDIKVPATAHIESHLSDGSIQVATVDLLEWGLPASDRLVLEIDINGFPGLGFHFEDDSKWWSELLTTEGAEQWDEPDQENTTGSRSE